ncbi:hypothetical protein [Streptomyces sp. NPDC088358]|uniref:hypothetical protein n=1 Tax=Streptomyces sp. NPDC088358 TaxID=3365857 RepID=UPI0038207D91
MRKLRQRPRVLHTTTAATEDKAIPPALEHFGYQRAHARVVEVRGASHAAMVSHPGTVTHLTEEAARTTAD